MIARVWKKCSLKQFATIYSGTDYKRNKKGEDFPIVGTGGIIGYTGDFLYEGPAVLTGRKGTIDKPIYLEGKFWNVDTIFCIKPFDSTFVKYFYYALSNKNLLLLNEATGVPSVSSDNLYKQIFILPQDIKEQKHIADILTTCDTVIQKTQKTIDKYKAIKQGMMQDLFTRGLTKDGKLRPSYKEAPELYKESELGMIPKEWAVKTFLDITSKILGGGTPSRNNENYWKGFIPWVTVKDFSNFNPYGAEEYITELGLKNSASNLIPVGYLIIATRISLGKAYYYHIPVAINQDMKAILFNNDAYMPFMFYWFQQNCNLIENKGMGSTVKGIQQSDLMKLKIKLPADINEQMNISSRLSTIDTAIKKEEAVLEKYKNIKTGLMARLLTPPEDAEIIDETGE